MQQREGIKETFSKIICAHSTVQIPRVVNGAGAHFKTAAVTPRWAASLETQKLTAITQHTATLWPKFVAAHEQSYRT